MQQSSAQKFLLVHRRGLVDACPYIASSLENTSTNPSGVVSHMLMSTSLLYLCMVKQDPWFGMSDFTCSVCHQINSTSFPEIEISSMEFMKKLLGTVPQSGFIAGHLAPLSSLKRIPDRRIQNDYHKSLMGFVMHVSSVDHVTPMSIKEKVWEALVSPYSVYR